MRAILIVNLSTLSTQWNKTHGDRDLGEYPQNERLVEWPLSSEADYGQTEAAWRCAGLAVACPGAPHTHVLATQGNKLSTPWSDYLGKIRTTSHVSLTWLIWTKVGQWIQNSIRKTTIKEKWATICLVVDAHRFGRSVDDFGIKMVTSHCNVEWLKKSIRSDGL